jgi:hypothetical protein
MFEPILKAKGPWPEWPDTTLVFDFQDWDGNPLFQLTLGELKALKALVTERIDENKSKSLGPSRHLGAESQRG